MPTIKLPSKKEKERPQRLDNTDSRELRRKAYNNTKWRKVRDLYMQQHPLCERCLAKGKVTPAQDIHHIHTPFGNNQINYEKLLDSSNLQALCKECHGEIHAMRKERAADIIRQLDELLNEN